MNLDHIGKEVDVTCIHSTNENNNISMNDDANFPRNIMHLLNLQITMKMYIQEHNTAKKNEEFIVIKIVICIYY